MPARCIYALNFLLLAAAIGCGGTTYPTVTGSWKFAAISSTTPSEPPQSITGTLSSSGSSITGTLTYSNSCFNNQALYYSGSFSSGNLVKLTSETYNNQVITLNGTVSSDGSFLTQGSYSVAAENTSPAICDIADSGTLSGSRTTNSQ